MSVIPRQSDRTIAPYWNRFPSFFLYPFSFEPLLTLVVLSVIGVFGLYTLKPIALVWMFLLFRYCFRVLERTALGFLNSDSGAFMTGHGGRYLPYKQFLIILFFIVLVAAFGALLGPVPALLVGFVLLLVLPASIMVLAVTNSLIDALNPNHLWPMVSEIGLPYFGMVGCLTMLTSSGGAVEMLLAPLLPEAAQVFVSLFAAGFFAIVSYRLMGYVMYQYHREIGLEVRVQFDDRQNVNDPKAQQAAELAELLKSGRIDEALEQTRQATRDYPMDIDVHERYHQLLRRLPDRQPQLAEHAQRFLPLLMSEQRASMAVRVIESVLEVVPDFQPAQPREVLPLATAAFEQRRFEVAMKLMRGFDRRHPKHSDIPGIYLLGARILCEHLRNDAQALLILSNIRQRFPDHPASVEAEKLSTVIERLQAGT
ncbi:tetratricopeptide repeat protein [Chitinimonas lacunae]|uniref:Tol-pal system YbgF family protein n=1 Tax=Chitinimonas lacunae TaxID=1963018 RepID=A0ABV8MS25_9NEIS